MTKRKTNKISKINSKNSSRLEGNLKYLLSSVVLLILIYPFLERGNVETSILSILSSILLILGIFAISYNKRHIIFALILGIPALASNWLTFYSQTLHIIVHVCAILFYLYLIVILLTYILTVNKVTGNILYGAITVYLLIGITFGAGYALLETAAPHSFSFQHNIIDQTVWSNLFFYSFTTLTSTGYGDILPMSSYARSLSIIEVILGEMYIAILISRMVGLYIHYSTTKEN